MIKITQNIDSNGVGVVAVCLSLRQFFGNVWYELVATVTIYDVMNSMMSRHFSIKLHVFIRCGGNRQQIGQ